MYKWIDKKIKNPEENRQLKQKIRKNFYILRVFTNSHAIKNISKKFCDQKQIDTTICKYLYVESIPTLIEDMNNKYGKSEQTTNLFKDLISFFGGCNSGGPSLTNMYLDHKISDYSSSISLSLTTGIIPNKCAYFGGEVDSSCDVWGNEIATDYARREGNKKDCLEEKATEPPQRIIPLINSCDYSEIEDIYDGKWTSLQGLMEEAQEKRCPYAWYKLLNYETATLDLSSTRIIADSQKQHGCYSGFCGGKQSQRNGGRKNNRKNTQKNKKNKKSKKSKKSKKTKRRSKINKKRHVRKSNTKKK
jgi:hypothetical protein